MQIHIIMRWSWLLLSTIAIIAMLQVSAQAQDPTYWWSSFRSPRLYDYVITNPKWGTILCIERQGCFSGVDLDSLTPLLSVSEFAHVESGTRAALLNNGTFIIGGGPLTPTTLGRAYLWRTASDSPRILTSTDLGGQNLSTGFGMFDAFTTYEPNGIQIRDAYSTNSGSTWSYAPAPDSTGKWDSYAYDRQRGFRSYSPTAKQWYSLDMLNATWSPVDLPGDIVDLQFLKNGAAVGVSEQFEIRTGIALRSSENNPWQYMPEPVRADGKVISFGLPQDNIGPMIPVDDSTVVIALDSGVIIVTDGHTYRTYSLPEVLYNASVNPSPTQRDVEGDTVLLDYRFSVGLNTRQYCVRLNVRTGQTRIAELRASGVLDLHYGAVQLYDHERSGLIYEYSDAQRVLIPRMRVYDTAGNPLSEANHVAVVSDADTLWTVTDRGAIISIASGNAIRIPVTASIRTGQASSQHVLDIGSEVLFAHPDGLLVRGNNLALANTDSVRYLMYDTVSAVEWSSRDVLWAGWKVLHRSVDMGRNWLDVSIDPGVRDSRSAISSIVDVPGGPLVMGSRGYVVRENDEPVDTVHGGIILSKDNGLTWSAVPVPVQGLWIERVTLLKGGSLFAWVADMAADVETGSGMGRTYRHNDWNLIVSNDTGRTWRTSFSLSFSESSATPAAWSIVSNSSGDVAISTPSQVFLSSDLGRTWSEELSLPFNISVGGIAYDGSGQLWVGTNRGIFGIGKTTSVSGEVQIVPTFGAWASPNPFIDEFIIRVRNLHQRKVPISMLKIVDVNGRVVRDFLSEVRSTTGSDLDIHTSLSTEPAGIYLLVFDQGQAVRSWPMIKVQQ